MQNQTDGKRFLKSTSMSQIIDTLFKHSDLKITNKVIEKESTDYQACHFNINTFKIICRTAKITPKKIGQFVTFWKRDTNGPIAPFHTHDAFDFYIIPVFHADKSGLFIIPKEVLIKKGIVSTDQKEGKRGFRVYPPWDKTISTQAIRTQKWQGEYFIDLGNSKDIDRMKQVFMNSPNIK